MKKLLATAVISLSVLPVHAADQAIVDKYNKTCKACHETGAAGAPKTGDADVWNKRLEEKGMDALVASAKNGLNAMPPKAMCYDCTDEDYKALIEYMAAPK